MGELNLKDLQRADYFGALSEDKRAFLLPLFTKRTFSRGEILFEQGEERKEMFLITQGDVELLDSSVGWSRSFTVCGPGTLLGDTLIIEDEAPYRTTGRAVSDGTLAVLAREKLLKLREDNLSLFTELVLAVSKAIADRIMRSGRGDHGRGAVFGVSAPRVEHDLLGDREVPSSALWGIQTLRAVENFPILGVRLESYPELIEALSEIKRACAIANAQIGDLDEERCQSIVDACDEICKGLWHGHFVVDMIQGGAGTSTNMNANEVIANRALELLGHERAQYDILHPNTHVNMSQSTNDVYPSAIRIALLKAIRKTMEELSRLVGSFEAKGREFENIIKMGRTQLQDAVPMSLGQEFRAWGRTLREGGLRIEQALHGLLELNLGGTAIGTGLNADPEFARIAISELSERLGMSFVQAEDLIEATQDTSSFVELSGVLKMFAVRLSKICNDLRLLSSGPRCGLNEINLPPVQPGSSIMPGKVNPVIPEVVNQVAFQIVGLDTAVALAAEGGQLELNVFEPLIAFNLFTSIHMLHNAMLTLRIRCIEGITANEEVCRRMVYNSIGVVTALNPSLGYSKTSEVAKEALVTGRPVYEIVLERGYLTREQLDVLLDPRNMIHPRAAKKQSSP
ncbi:MAG: aspartate ammonia-lyase [Myxococcales bacterium]|nr:aspartate ammonia-lyase [Myxococcales bacterium]